MERELTVSPLIDSILQFPAVRRAGQAGPVFSRSSLQSVQVAGASGLELLGLRKDSGRYCLVSHRSPYRSFKDDYVTERAGLQDVQ